MLKQYKQWDKKELHQVFQWSFGIFFVCSIFLLLTSFYLYKDKKNEGMYWEYYLKEHDQLTKEEKHISKNATRVKSGIYLENIDDLNIKNSNYTVKFKIWFSWENNNNLNMLDNYMIYHGKINEQKILENKIVGKKKYQLAEVSATINKVFWTTRFPLGSYQLRLYIEPQYNLKDVLIEPDPQSSSVNKNLNVSGFTVNKFAVSRCIQNISTTPSFSTKKTGTSEFLAAVELNRKGIGLYLKCFIALAGTLGWVLITLFLCTYHEVDPLGMIPSALFGTVSNILVGANLVPDAIQTGLIEFVNIYGILLIIFVALAVIKINRTRDYYKNNDFAFFLGRHIFWVILFLAILGNILLPLIAYKF
uniref:hypothetical protein n=1 Tax=Lactococcus garvieae TaxID=1363 RepID=UPI00359C78D3